MRLTTVLRRLLGVTQMHVRDAHLGNTGPLTVRVRPSWRRSRCGTCGERAPRYDRRPTRQWRHAPWGTTPVSLQYQPVAKVDDCGSTRSIEFRTLDSHGDGQKTGGATGVADVGGHGGPSDE